MAQSLFVTYSHAGNLQLRYRQAFTDKLPPWAVSVEIENEDGSEFDFTPYLAETPQVDESVEGIAYQHKYQEPYIATGPAFTVEDLQKYGQDCIKQFILKTSLSNT